MTASVEIIILNAIDAPRLDAGERDGGCDGGFLHLDKPDRLHLFQQPPDDLATDSPLLLKQKFGILGLSCIESLRSAESLARRRQQLHTREQVAEECAVTYDVAVTRTRCS